MRSRHSLDSWVGLLVAGLLVGAVGAGAVLVDRHAEQHGHGAPLAMIDVELAQRLQRDVGGQGGGVVHASFFATGSVSDAVRRGGTESDGVGQ